MKTILLFIVLLSITIPIYAENVKISIEETGKQLSDNTVKSITIAGYFYLADNIPHAFQVNLSGDDVKGTNVEIKARAKGKIKKLIQGFKKANTVSEVKDNSLKESYVEDIN